MHIFRYALYLLGGLFAGCGLCCAGAAEMAAADASPRTALELSSETRYQRRGEGDFVALADGRLLFLYSRFTVMTDGDQSPAHIASRASADGGRTWSGEGQTLFENEDGMNLMSVSLLRLQDGRIALFYMRKNSMSDCRPVVRFSADDAETWSEEQSVIPEEDIGYYVLNNDRVVQLRSGRLVAPVSLHHGPGWKR